MPICKSLSATFLRNQIISALRASDLAVAGTDLSKTIPPNLVFSYSSLSSLASHIAQLTSISSNGGSSDPLASFAERSIQKIEHLISRFSQGLSAGARQTGELILPSVVLLTGTTGSLGSFLLASLLEDERISRVYAYNRPGKKSSKERQIDSFVDRDLPLKLLDSDKLVFLEGVSANDKLDLEPSQYEEVCVFLKFL
jgi:FlaA1/EpsC-like NDP-sugar epimerase